MLQKIIYRIDRCLENKKPLIVAIDGRCASGKTTLAGKLQQHYGCNVVSMDQFFLRPEQRTKERLAKPGENVDHERFLEEVLLPLSRGETVTYRPYDCSVQALAEPITLKEHPLTVVEGSYSFHGNLRDSYDLRIFLQIDPVTQMERILHRNGAQMAEIFKNRWIPLEESYFETFDIQQYADLCLSNAEQKGEDHMLAYFKSVMEQDTSPVVICDTAHKIRYMNPAACESYAKDGGAALVGKDLMACHPPRSRAAIEKVVAWFSADRANNRVHTFYNKKDNRDVYMIALRNDDGALIGYYEQHISRTPDPTPLYLLD